MRKSILTALMVMSIGMTTVVQAQELFRPGTEVRKMTAPVRHESRPLSLDNSLSPYFPPVVSQYGGSCAQASGIHYLFTYEMNRYLERPVKNNNSNIFSYRWTWNFLNEGKDEGSFASDGIEITQKFGCMTVANFGGSEDEYLYRWTNGYKRYYDAMHYRTKEMKEVDLCTTEDIENLMDYMIDKNDGHPGGGIASFSISGNEWGYKSYEGPSETGIDMMILLKGSAGPHAMTLVGYDLSFEYDFDRDSIISDIEKGAFVLMNSWGTWWGTEGKAFMPFYYFLIDYADGGMSGYNKNALCIDVEYFEPQITFSAKLRYSSRNDLTLSMGVADGAQATGSAPKTLTSNGIFKAQGGDLYMQGSTFSSSMDIEVGLDFSSKTAAVDTMVAPCYFFNVMKSVVGKSGNGYVSEVVVHDYRTGKEVTYSQTWDNETGKIQVGSNRFKIPTKNWVKNSRGQWLEQTTTSASPAGFTYETGQKAPVWSVRTANGDYSTMKVAAYDQKTQQIIVNFDYYEK